MRELGDFLRDGPGVGSGVGWFFVSVRHGARSFTEYMSRKPHKHRRFRVGGSSALPAWRVRRVLDDPRGIPYLLAWKSPWDGEIKEAVRYRTITDLIGNRVNQALAN
jgi:hypothetical protein